MTRNIGWTDANIERLRAYDTDDKLRAAISDPGSIFYGKSLAYLKKLRGSPAASRAKNLKLAEQVPATNGAGIWEDETAIHIVIPDTQVKPGVPTDHLRWIGRYIVDHFAGKANVKIIHIGDHADMPSLSSYDRGTKSMEGRRYRADIQAANAGFDVLCKPLDDYNLEQAAAGGQEWWPERHIALGNHEDRITRACEHDAQLDGMLSLDDLNYADHGWQVHPYLKPFYLDGIGYVHYWAHPMTGKPYGGMVSTRLKTIGHSFTMGHQQTLDFAVRFVTNPSTGKPQAQWGLVAGACYLHDEEYKGYQGNAHWRGIIVCHEVNEGSYDPMFISLDYLCRRYEGMSLSAWMTSSDTRSTKKAA
jgi:hypothetical protein